MGVLSKPSKGQKDFSGKKDVPRSALDKWTRDAEKIIYARLVGREFEGGSSSGYVLYQVRQRIQFLAFDYGAVKSLIGFGTGNFLVPASNWRISIQNRDYYHYLKQNKDFSYCFYTVAAY
jgi:hypothetical protein